MDSDGTRHGLSIGDRLRMGRLFRKLFLAFWLAMMLSFLAGMTYLSLTGQHGRDEQIRGLRADLMFKSAETVVARDGIDAGLALLARWRDTPYLPRMDLIDGEDRDRFPVRGETRVVKAPDGSVHHLVSDSPAIEVGPISAPMAVPIVSGAVVGFLFSLFLAWYLSRPLQHLRWGFDAVAQGRFDTRIMPRMGRQRDEIVDLARDFDKMAARLQALVDARQRLLHDISHELRSPLTRLQVAIGLAKQNPQKTDQMLERIDHEAERLDAMVEELLTLARLESGPETLPRERVDLIELLGAIAEDAAFEAQAAGKSVDFSATGRFVADVSGELLYRAFENVIRNAVKFTRPGTCVTVEARIRGSGEGGDLDILVTDHGPGVPVDMLDRIFEPFLRVDVGVGVTGFGLGLAISRRAIESHGGRIRADLAGDGGLLMRITLPGARA